MANSQVKPNALFKQLISIASKYVECHDKVTKELVDRSKGVFSLRNTEHPIVMDGKPGFYLLKVKNANALFLHISVTLKAPNERASLDSVFAFEGISIQFLQGTGHLFCRAEWDVKKKNEKLEHPQPHWHWAGERPVENHFGFDDAVNNVNDKGDFLEEIADVEPVLPSVDFNELHYAMASKWSAQGGAVEEFTPQRLYEWLKRCLGSVVDQYNYQVNKGAFVSSMDWV